MEENWECIMKKVEQIGEIADEMNWPELAKMVADAYVEAEKETDPIKLFFDVYQFMFRLYYRVKDMKEPQPFNEIYNDYRLIDHENSPMFRIVNYDYKSYLWAKRKGFSEYVTNGYFLVRKSDLSPEELKMLEKKVVE